MTIQPLTRVDVTRFPVTDWRVAYLSSHGFRVETHRDRVLMVRERSSVPRTILFIQQALTGIGVTAFLFGLFYFVGGMQQ